MKTSARTILDKLKAALDENLTLLSPAHDDRGRGHLEALRFVKTFIANLEPAPRRPPR